MPEKLVDGRAVAEHIGVAYRTVMRWCQEGLIPHHVLGQGRRRKTIRFRLSEIEEWINSGGHYGGSKSAQGGRRPLVWQNKT